MTVRVLLAGGGTAGHTSPLLATADALRDLMPAVEITVLGTPRGLETRVVPAAGYPLELVPPVPLPRRLSRELLEVPGRLRATVRATGEVLDRLHPDVVVGFGGYVSVPAYVAGWRRGLPMVVHEQNALPGLANRLGARWTPHVATSFPRTPLPHARMLGLPVRRLVSGLDRLALRAEARAALGLHPELPTLLVFGGSQGARRLNQAVAGAARELAAAGAQVLHVSGPQQQVQVPAGLPYVVVPYVDRMDHAYAAADLAVCRAGASTVTEVACVGLPAVFVPLPIGNGEQARNARPVVDSGGGLLVDDADLTADWVASHVPRLLADTAGLSAMSSAAAGTVPRDADVRLARMILGAAGVDAVGLASTDPAAPVREAP